MNNHATAKEVLEEIVKTQGLGCSDLGELLWMIEHEFTDILSSDEESRAQVDRLRAKDKKEQPDEQTRDG